jgi:hypothetical protein
LVEILRVHRFIGTRFRDRSPHRVDWYCAKIDA